MAYLPIIFLLAGFVCLWKGGDWLVEGSADIARLFKLSPAFIGLTLVAFGTSAPELIVNVIASFQGNTDIVFGNILGSNISNTLLILGLTALLFPIKVKETLIRREMIFSLLTVFILLFLISIPSFEGPKSFALSRLDGVILLVCFGFFLKLIYNSGKNQIPSPVPEEKVSSGKAIVLFLGGIVLLPLGGKLVVDNAITLSQAFAISEAFMGLFAVALGTSLPELATCIIAVRKDSPDLAVGNIIGSNIFNIIFILGIGSLIKPLPFNPVMFPDIYVIVAATFLFLVFMKHGKSFVFERHQGFLFVASYFIYITYIFLRG